MDSCKEVFEKSERELDELVMIVPIIVFIVALLVFIIEKVI